MRIPESGVPTLRKAGRKLLLALGLAGLGPAALQAATVTVTSTADSGTGTLRAAIAAAGSGDTIRFDLPTPARIFLSTPLSLVNKTLTIEGLGANVLVLDGGNMGVSGRYPKGGTRIFDISGGAVTLKGLRISRGYVRAAGQSGAAAGGNGAGIRVTGSGTLGIDACTFESNYADDNIADVPLGGAIYNDAATLTITHSAFFDNHAGMGGAIYNHNGSVTITNTTLSANGAGYGGAIFQEATSSSNDLTLVNCTLANNASTSDSASGGLSYYKGSFNLLNTLVSGSSLNSGNSLADIDTSIGSGGSFKSQGHNLVTNQGTLSVTTGTGDLIGASGNVINARIDGLDRTLFQGGTTPTHPLQSSSAAVDAGASSGGPSDDQRGRTRSTPDIGAFEYGAAGQTWTLAGNAGTGGAVIVYYDNGPKVAVAAGDGSYSITVPNRWSGTVVPALAGYTFSPRYRRYDTVTASAASQDFTAAGASTTVSETLSLSFGGSVPTGLAVGDFDGDGRPDLAVTANSSNTVSVMLNAGNYTYQSAVPYAVGSSPFGVAVGDFNRDGKLDLAVTNAGGSSVSILLGNGDGSFQTAVNYSLSGTPRDLVVGDFNRDGKLDLAVANRGSNAVSVLLGNGDGTFGGAADTAAGSGARGIAVGDLNRDGKLDLVTANDTAGTVSVLLGNGNGTFAAAVPYTAGSGASTVSVADLNGDGNLDLAVANRTGGSVSVLLGTSSGTFGTAANYTVGSAPSAVSVVDFNGDGKPDLLTVDAGSNVVSLLPGNGDGTFLTRVALATGSSPVGLAVTDTNGDGLPDLVAANSGDNTLSVLLNGRTSCGALAFAAESDTTVGTHPQGLAYVDLDGDGKPELVAVNAGSNTVSVLPGQGGAAFGTAVNFSVGSSPGFIAVADLNQDGKPDLIVSNAGSNTVSLLRNTTTTPGTITFASAVNLGVGSNPYAVVVLDVNGDGKPDLAVGNAGTNTVSVLVNNTSAGAGSFSFFGQQTFTTNASGPNALAVADVNRDGKPDLLVGQSFGGVSVLLNNTTFGSTSAAFLSAQTVSTAGAVYGIAVADFNGDGLPDLAVSNASQNTVSVMLNATDQGGSTVSFGSASNFSVGSNPRLLVAADLDGDGRPDLAVSNLGAHNATMLLNTTLRGTSTPSFGTGTTLSLNGTPYGLVAADLGPDGRTDLAFCDFDNGKVAVLACAPPTNTISGNLGSFGAGATVSYVSNGKVRTATADGSANYSFTVPCSWAGRVVPSLTGRVFTPGSREHVFVRGNVTADYSSVLVRFTISGNTGVAGATVRWLDGSLQTITSDGSGAYSFTVPYGWSDIVYVSKAGYDFNPSIRSYSSPGVTSDQSGQNFTATPITYTVSGSAGAGTTLSWTDGSAKTTTADGSGNYSFTVSYNWTGTLKASKAGTLFSPAKIDFTNVLADSTGNAFTPIACTIAADASVMAGTAGHVATLPSQVGATYTWAITNGTLTAGQGTNSVTYTAGTSGSVALGCTLVDAVGSTLTPSASVGILTYTAPITTPNPVTAGATGIPASVPALDGATYTWSATNGTITSGQGTSAVTYTAGSTGSTVLMCQVVAGGVTTYGNRTVTVVASPATITASSPVQAEGQGYTASVPSQAGATYAWTLNNGTITAGQGTNVITYTAGAAGPVDLGCTVTIGGTPYVGSKTVTAVPYAATITASTPVFAGQTGLKAFVPVRDGATYTWSVSNGSITDGQGTNTVTYTAGSAGTLTVSCDVVTSGTVSGSKTVTVLADPTAITAETSVIAMTANHRASVPSQADATYTWTLTNGTIVSGQGTYAITYTAGSAGTLALGVTVTDGAGNSLSGSRSVSVATYTAPIVAPSPVVTGTAGLTATVFPVDGGTYAWSITNGTLTAGQGTYAVTFTAGATGTTTLLCQVSAGGLVTYGSRSVTVVDAPATISASSTVQAGGQGYAASVANQAGATYSWSITNGTITSGQSAYAVIFTAGSAGSVDLSCTVTLGGTPYVGTKSITAVPYAATISGSNLVFAGQTGLKATVPALSGATYNWAITNGSITGGQGTASLTYTAGAAGTLSLSCDVTTSGTVTGSKSVTVLSDATAITAETSVIAMTAGHKASVAPQPGATYSWSATNGTITGGQGTYSVTYTAGSTGSLTLNCTLTDNTGNSIYPTRSVAVSNYTAPITAASPVVTGTTGLAASVLAADGATYAWSVTGGTLTSGQGTTAITYTAGATGTATLLCQVTTGGLVTYGSRSVTVVDDPAAITTSSPVQAGGQGYAASVPNQAGATYLWTISNGTITSGQGSYAVIFTAGSAGSVDLGCTVTIGGTPYVGAKSVTAVPYAATITGSNLVFAGQTGLKASVPVLSGATYAWSVTNGTITGGQGTASVVYTAGSAGTLTLACDVTSTGTVSGSKSVTVLAGASSITAETTVVATTTGHKASVPPQTGATYTWTVTNGTITGGQGTYSMTYTSGAAGTLTVGCTVTDGAGNSQSGSRSVNVSTYLAPVATATPVVAGTPNHTASVPAVDGGTYAWSVTGGTLTSGQGTPNITYTAGAAGSGSVQCTVTVGGVPVYGSHSVSIVASPATIVVVSSVQAGAQGYVATVPTQSGATYLWTINNGTITAGQGTASITFTAGTPGPLDLGCTVTVGGTPTPGTKSIPVVPYTAPVTVPTLAYAGQTGLAASVPALAGATYAWNITNGTITAGQGTRQVTFTAGSAGTATLSCDVTTSGTVTGSKSLTVLDAAATISVESSVRASSPNHRASVAAQTGAIYTWTVTNGTITGGQGTSTLTYTAGSVGTLTVGCTITDAAGNAVSNTQNVTVN